MKWLVLVCMMLLGIIAGTDLMANCFHNLKRLHIGRWKNRGDWEEAVKIRSYKWLKRTPTVKMTDNAEFLIFDILQGKRRNDTIQSWQMAGLVLGINCVRDEESQKKISEWKNTILNSNGTWKRPVKKVDFAMLGYAVLRTENNIEKVRPAMDWIIQMLEDNMCEDGMISYSQGKRSPVRFIDTLGMVCPFLALYGKKYGKFQYIDIAVKQIENFHKQAMCMETELPCHAFDVGQHLPLGIYGWGRGAAWYMLALIDTWRELEKNEYKIFLENYIYKAAECYSKYQQGDGGFNTILQGGGTYDSSVTAAMAYFYSCCSMIFGNKEFKAISEKCMTKLISVTMKNGAIDQCQGDTHGIGVFSQVFDIMPFVQGLVLRVVFGEKCNKIDT